MTFISPRAPRHLRRNRAFTLIELILAMSLVALLSLTMYTTVHIAYRARRTAEATVQPTRAATMAIDLVSQDLQSVLPPTGILRGPFTGSTQAGGGGVSRADVVDFYSLGEDATPLDQTAPMDEGIRLVELAVRTDVDPPVLVRRVRRNLLSTNEQPPDEEVLCRGVRSFTLRYFDGTSWYDGWDSTQVDDNLPLAVQITLEVQKDPSQPLSRAANPLPPGQADPDVYRITRVIPMACGKQVDASDVDTSGASTGGSSGGSQ